MKEVELLKDWQIRAGVLIPAGAKIKLADVYIQQLQAKGFIKSSNKQKSR